MSKDIVTQCLNKASKIIESIPICVDCFELFVDYNPLRHPYTYLLAMLIKCPTNSSECEEIYDVVMEITMNIDSILRELFNLDRDLVNIRIKCDDGWFEYGYVVQRSAQSMASVSKGFSVFYGGRRFSLESIDQKFLEKVQSSLVVIVKRAKEVVDQEGIV